MEEGRNSWVLVKFSKKKSDRKDWYQYEILQSQLDVSYTEKFKRSKCEQKKKPENNFPLKFLKD